MNQLYRLCLLLLLFPTTLQTAQQLNVGSIVIVSVSFVVGVIAVMAVAREE